MEIKTTTRFFCYDTETTGLMESGESLYGILTKIQTQIDSSPFILSLAYTILEVDHVDGIIKAYRIAKTSPDIYLNWNVDISAQITAINRITREIVEEKAIGTPADTLSSISLDLLSCDCIVAHNANFDAMMLSSNIVKASQQFPERSVEMDLLLKSFFTLDIICTAQFSAMIWGTYPKQFYGGPVQLNRLKLENMYFKLFNEKFPDAHNARVDTDALVKCFINILSHYDKSVLKTDHTPEQYLSVLTPEHYENARLKVPTIPPVDSEERLNFASILLMHQRGSLRSIRKQSALVGSIFGIPAIS